MRLRDILSVLTEATEPVTLYHITNKAKFRLDPNFEPEDNAVSIMPRGGHKGIYLTPDVEKWVNGHGYIRPFVAEIHADPSALEHDRIGRWGGEVFIPSDQFHKLKVVRVIPIDAYVREKYGEHGWIERYRGREFDTGREISREWRPSPFKGYRHEGDVRTMSPDEVKRLKQHFNAGFKVLRKDRGM
jgi:hypothetical protein